MDQSGHEPGKPSRVCPVLSTSFETDLLPRMGRTDPETRFFPEMVRRAFQSGARLVLCTNGVKLPDLSLLVYFDAIIFRLDYGRASTYERRNPLARFNRVVFQYQPRPVSAPGRHDQASHSDSPVLQKNRYSLPELTIYLDTAIRLNPDLIVFLSADFSRSPG